MQHQANEPDCTRIFCSSPAMIRSFRNYILMEKTNTAQPGEFIANKVTGILFENKCDHATYFVSHECKVMSTLYSLAAGQQHRVHPGHPHDSSQCVHRSDAVQDVWYVLRVSVILH